MMMRARQTLPNVRRADLTFGDGHAVPYYIIDLDWAWFNPPFSLAGEASNKGLPRSGLPGCRWI
jgi:hypothetical protein